MNIVLGIFDTPFFYKTAWTEGNCSYPFDKLDPNIQLGFSNIVDIVYYAAIKAEIIIFIIDDLQPNITGDEDSYTCKELITLLSSPFIPLNKIVFMEDNIVVHSDYVLTKLNLTQYKE